MRQTRRLVWLSLCLLTACNGVTSLGRGRDGRDSAGKPGDVIGDNGGASGESDSRVPSAGRTGNLVGGAPNAAGKSSSVGKAGNGSGGLGGSSGGGAGSSQGTTTERTTCANLPELDGPLEITLPGVISGVVPGDWNHDGTLDVAVLSTNAKTVSVLLGRGDGTFVKRTDYVVAAETSSLLTGDVDGDGRLDLLSVSGSGPSTVSVLLGNADGSFGPGSSVTAHVQWRQVLLDDFDADGRLDLAVVDDDSGGVSILGGAGDGTFESPRSVVSDNGYWLASGDLNADRARDLVLFGGPEITVVLNRGDGTFGAPSTYSAGGDASFLRIRDFDGDGNIDLLMETECDPVPGDGMFMLRGRGDGTFAPGALVADSCDSGSNVLSPAITADFDGDGNFDLLQSGGYVIFGQSNGVFEPGPRDAPLWADNFASGDFNGDGRVDVVTGIQDKLAIQLGDGEGSFSPHRTYSVGAFVSGSSPSQVLLQDVNLDGHSDLVVANTTPPSLSVMYGAGDGSFSGTDAYPFDENVLPTQPASELTGIVSTELNGDGRPDFLLLDGNASNVGVLLSAAASTYRVDSVLPMGDGCFSAAVADLNADGELDLVTANARVPTLSVRLGTGGGSFGPRTDVAVELAQGDSADGVVLGDLNGDGKPDAVVSTWGHGVTVLLGGGDGTFVTGANYSSKATPPLMALADFDRDGVLDLAFTKSSSVRVLRGVGDGTFAGSAEYALTPSYESSLSVNDVDGDGNLDVLIAGDQLVVLFGDSDGTFPCLQTYATGSGMVSLAAGDLNGDGTLDLVGLSYDDATVFLNPPR